MASRDNSSMLALLQSAQPLPACMLDTLSLFMALPCWTGHQEVLLLSHFLSEGGAQPSPFEMWRCITQMV